MKLRYGTSSVQASSSSVAKALGGGRKGQQPPLGQSRAPCTPPLWVRQYEYAIITVTQHINFIILPREGLRSSGSCPKNATGSPKLSPDPYLHAASCTRLLLSRMRLSSSVMRGLRYMSGGWLTTQWA